jgi:hypothetical protein
MFSNVRPYGKARIFGYAPRWRARYYTVEWKGELTDETLRSIPEHTRQQLRSGSHVFSGPVASEFVRVAERSGQEVAIVPVGVDAEMNLTTSLATKAKVHRGPLWVAPSISRQSTAAHLG